MSLSKKIEAGREKLTNLKDQLVESTKSLEAAPDEETLLAEVEELTEQVEQLTKHLRALEKAEKALAEKAQAIKAEGPAVTVDMQKRNAGSKRAAGDLIVKHGVASFLAHVEKKTVAQVIQERYGDQPEVAETYNFVKKSQIDPAMTRVTGWAAELTREDTRGFIESLEDVSVAAALASYANNVDFGGANSIKVPVEDAVDASPTEPAWVAEGSPIPLTKFGFTSVTLNRYKLAAITTMTAEIAERSTPAIEGVLRNALRKKYARVLDQALLSNTAAVQYVRPAGLLLPADLAGGALITATAGGGDDAVRGDLQKLLAAHIGNRTGERPVLIMNNLDRLAVSMMTSTLSEYVFRDELSNGTLGGIPVISSAAVPQHMLLMVDASLLWTAFDAPEFNVSDVATVVESSADDVAPTMASTAAGAAGTEGQVGPTDGIPVNEDGRPKGAADAGFKARSLWQTNSIGLRMIAPTTWQIARKGTVAAMNATTWTS